MFSVVNEELPNIEATELFPLLDMFHVIIESFRLICMF